MIKLPERTFFVEDGQRGPNSGDDPHDSDRGLAITFMAHLNKQRLHKLSTPTANGLSDVAGKISDRYNQAGLLVLLGRELQPIAKKLMALGPSDRVNPDIIVFKFTGFDPVFD